MPPEIVNLQAPAKLTLSLRVTGVRADGYHLIDAEMVSLDLADELELTPLDDHDHDHDHDPDGDRTGARSATSRLSIVDAVGVTHGTGDAPDGRLAALAAEPDNLVLRALALAGRAATVRLTKRIPPGAGLGGGSSDAAAVLRWAGATDLDAAARLGADVAFCVVGGRARVRGIGEIVEPLPFAERTLTLLTPPFGCATPAVYRAWDDLGGPSADGPNDLEPAALLVEPRLARYRDELGDATGQTPRLAGSGSTWFVEGAHPGPGRVVTRTIPPR